jgi:hypothetical protein
VKSNNNAVTTTATTTTDISTLQQPDQPGPAPLDAVSWMP